MAPPPFSPGDVVLVRRGAGGRSPSRYWVGLVLEAHADDLKVAPLELAGRPPPAEGSWTSILWEDYARLLANADLARPGPWPPEWEDT